MSADGMIVVHQYVRYYLVARYTHDDGLQSRLKQLMLILSEVDVVTNATAFSSLNIVLAQCTALETSTFGGLRRQRDLLQLCQVHEQVF